MPSNKPQIIIRTTQEIIDKLDKIANKENRSRGNLAETVLIDFLKEYEDKNGKIKKNDMESLTSKIG